MRKLLASAATFVLALSLLAVPATAQQPDRPASPPGSPGLQGPPIDMGEMPLHIHGGAWPTSHLQGIALDHTGGYMYWSFTQMLVKTDLDGNVLGTVEGITGHLGSMDFNPKDGRVYASLEYKAQEAFYVAIFDGDSIDEIGMNAETDGVMTTVYLDEVVEDYTADMDGDGHFDGDTADTDDHRYGSSGIDGIAFGPEFGKQGGKQMLMVAYGIYENNDRIDNDHQVILAYDTTQWSKYEQPLSQDDPHDSGPAEIDGKYFVFTGNTRYGVQNLDYDPHSGNWLMAVYEGSKPQYPNYSFFIVDGSAAPQTGLIRGQAEPEWGELLTLLPDGLYDAASGTFGWEFHGQFGIFSLGNGYYYVGEGQRVVEDGVNLQDGDVYLYRWTGEAPTPFELVTEPVTND
jgi:hypothetical protein